MPAARKPEKAEPESMVEVPEEKASPAPAAPEPESSDSGWYIVKTAFATEIDGVPTVVQAGEHVHQSSEVYGRAPGNFAPIENRSRFVEQATAAPGEKRAR